ncbi:MAG: GGDEF domain-containing protein [Alphaproteobacteria bacterium]|nr:GGDEF domain-containing protein [Alphaproteobacteria bacterium]
MRYPHDIKQAGAYASEAFERMRKEGLPPTPDVFEVWYIYYSHINPDVTRAIDILVANNQKPTEERCRELYERFLNNQNEDRVRSVGSKLSTTIKDVTGAVKNVREVSSKYSGTLEDVGAKLSGVEGFEDIEALLKIVVSDTEQMIQHNKKLETQLDQSTHAMETLQRDLETIRREALTDGLTGLANRKAFDDEIRRISSESDESKEVFTMLMVDIDHFKSFNDNFGHQVGDQVLRLVARTLVDGVKGRDVAARYGGEEFAIILPATELKQGLTVAENLRKTVATKDVINRNTGDKLGRITMSVGVAERYEGETVDELIERADAALYTAKHNGRNQVAAAPTPGKRLRKG